MASIQQSMNQAFASALGLATVGTYMYRQSDTYKAGVIDRQANKMGKTAFGGDPKDMTPEERAHNSRLGNTVEGLREQAASLSPTDKRLTAYENALTKNKQLQESLRKADEAAARRQSGVDTQEMEQEFINEQNERDEAEGVIHDTAPATSPVGEMSQAVAEYNAAQSLQNNLTTQNNITEAMSTREMLLRARQDPDISAKHKSQLFEMERRLAKKEKTGGNQ